MASTYSELKVELIGTGEQTGTWGTTTNNNLSVALGEAITGSADVTFTGADVTVTLTDTNAAQTARNLRLNLTGTSGGARNLILGSGCQIEKLYLINNGLADPVTVKNTTGSGVAVPAGKSMFVFNNGTNVVEVLNAAVTLEATQVNITGQGDLRLEDTSGGQYVALQAPGTLASSYTLTLPVDDGTNGQALITDGSGNLSWSTAASGDVYGPASSTTNAIPTFADTTGKLLQNNSGVTISSNTVTASGGFSTASNLTFTGTGNRITGDFSNATQSNRVAIQTSTTNGSTVVNTITNGSGSTSALRAFNTSTADTGAYANMSADASSVTFSSTINGAATALPLNLTATGATYIAINTNGNERMRITSGGDVGIGTSSPTNIGAGYQNLEVNGTTSGIISVSANGTRAFTCSVDGSQVNIQSRVSGQPMLFYTNGGSVTERMRIDSSGNVLVGATGVRGGVSTKMLVSSSSATNYLEVQNTSGAGASGDADVLFSSGSTGAYGLVGYSFTSNALRFFSNSSERMRITSSGNVCIGTTTTPNQQAVIYRTSATTSNGALLLDGNGSYAGLQFAVSGTLQGSISSDLAALYITHEDVITFNTGGSGNVGGSERMRITSGGELLVGKTALDFGTVGFRVDSDGGCLITRNGSAALAINRLTNDGDLVEFFQATTKEGSISVSGTTVSYNGGHLSRWSQLPSNQKDDTLLKGTVMSNLDDMCVWIKDGEVLPNEQLNKMKVSDVEGDTNVAGVFVDWQFDEQCQSDDMNVAMTGDMIIRIAQGVVVQKGDLLMSAGDGTAKPQGDDIRRSKTVAKVTSNHVTCTYTDGSYCVPCVLMAC